MPDGIRPPEFRGDPEAREANRLYWDTDESVNGIAERLELSKGRLYDVITPLPVGANCPVCGGPLGFANRTARDDGRVSCPLCDFTASRDEIDGDAELAPHPATRTADGPGHSDGTMIAAALIGVAVGLMLGRWLRS